MLKLLLSQFVKKNGRSPNAIEMLQLKFKASQQAVNERKIVNMFDRQPVDANKPILGGKNIIETDEQMIQRFKNQNKEAVERLKNKKEPEDMADGGVAGLLGERPEYRDGLKVYPKITASKSSQGLGNGKNVDLQDLTYGGTLMYDQGPFSAGIEYLKGKDKFDFKDEDNTLAKDTTDRELANLILMMKLKDGSIKFKGNKDNQMINIIKSFAQGGPARQNFKMGKRAFLKLIGGVGAGIAGIKSGLLGLGKGGAKKAVTETIKQSAGSGTPPPYFFKLVEKIKVLGDDITEKAATTERQKVTKYKDYELTEDVATGEQTIQKIKTDGPEYYDEQLAEEVYMNYKPGKGLADEGTQGIPADEYIEDTGYLRTSGPDKGELFDSADGLTDDSFKEIIEEIGEVVTKKADGGRIGYSAGSKVIGKGIMAGINKLFGKGTMTTADKIAQPEKTIQQRIMEFEARNKPDAITIEPRKFIDVPPMPAGFKLSKEKLIKNYPELDENMVNQIMELDKEMQGTVLTMLKNRRKNPDAYDKLLETKGDTLEFQGAFDEVTRKSNNADGGRIGYSSGSRVLQGILKLLKPKPKKQETVKSFLEKRQFLKNIVGNTEKNKKARELRMLKEAAEEARKNPGFKFKEVDIDKDIRPIFDLSKDRKLNATGGLANMLGE